MSTTRGSRAPAREAQGQAALIWSDGSEGVTVLAWRGSVLQFEDDPASLFEWNDQTAPGKGLWVWEGWARITEGALDNPRDREMIIGGDFRRLNEAELGKLTAGEDVLRKVPT